MENTNSNSNINSATAYVKTVIEAVEAQFNKRTSLSGLPTGIKLFDSIMGGLQKRSLTVLAGRPSTAKTSMALKFVTANFSDKRSKKIAIFTADQTAEDLTYRLISSRSNIPVRDIRGGMIGDNIWPKLISNSAEISSLQADIFSSTWISIKDIKAKAETGEYDLIIVDKFHSLMMKDEPQEGASNRINELNQSAIELKGIGKDNNIAVVLICDINKGQEGRSDKRPMLKDLKDMGGVLESYADVVVGMYIPEIDWEMNGNEIQQPAEAILMKNRFGPQGIIRINFDKYSQKVSDWEDPKTESLKS